MSSGTSVQCQPHFRTHTGPDGSQVISAGATGSRRSSPLRPRTKSAISTRQPANETANKSKQPERSQHRSTKCNRRIANLPHFLKLIEYDPEEGIVLQSMPDGTLRRHLEYQRSQISMAERLGVGPRHRRCAATRCTPSAGIHGDVKAEKHPLGREWQSISD
jgi:hypothetical protein